VGRGGLCEPAEAAEGRGRNVNGEIVYFFKHPLDHGASALCLPEFYGKASALAGSPDLFVGFTDPSELFVTLPGNTELVGRLREAVVNSDYWGSVHLTPACYRLTAAGLEPVVKRPDPKSP
jgi:hypothetical protein